MAELPKELKQALADIEAIPTDQLPPLPPLGGPSAPPQPSVFGPPSEDAKDVASAPQSWPEQPSMAQPEQSAGPSISTADYSKTNSEEAMKMLLEEVRQIHAQFDQLMQILQG